MRAPRSPIPACLSLAIGLACVNAPARADIIHLRNGATIAADSVVRVGPDPESLEMGNLLAGSSVVVRGRDPDGLWWYVEYPTGTSSRGWVFQAVTIWTFDVNIVPVVDEFGTPIFTSTPTQSTQSANNAGPPPGESATPQG